MFVDSAKEHGVGHGFYYSVVVNNFLNVQDSEVRDGDLAPGQVGITDRTYNEVVLKQLEELWGNYGDLTEIWFDGGYSATQKDKIQSLLQEKQPQAVIFGACDNNGTCISPNSIRWIGTEEGRAPEENWSTPIFCPSECDTTLQNKDRWFYGVNSTIRSLDEMIDVYHNTVGRNCLLELDLTPDRSGLIPEEHAKRYKELGDFIRGCYGKPIMPDQEGEGKDDGVYRLKFNEPTRIDRISLMEDQSDGQVIRSFGVYGKNEDESEMKKLASGSSIGHKRILIFDEPVSVSEVMVNTTFVDVPKWRSVSVHHCK
ncbi:hypothetical protein PHISCL_09851 [Aspergillus sclerotialis]|uniref:alpha-L-fucosidase n=1 Tax=Aspergillus sclerotialis TaxID=2070753 RepID=A0A3A2ZEQ7_9EURO|nr:hypothetical protein PHISCL_09851 [Aspergillus sclerotialis]